MRRVVKVENGKCVRVCVCVLFIFMLFDMEWGTAPARPRDCWPLLPARVHVIVFSWRFSHTLSLSRLTADFSAAHQPVMPTCYVVAY